MSTLPGLQPPEAPPLSTRDDETLQLANQDECVVNRLGAARGAIGGIIVGALLWAGLIVTGAILIHK